ncbi:DUF2231 domain-containing protein [Nonomuraea sediminis]|uniref:DUF2231 domain-containing protein n=1 Tax=Nonomuraea sediminis TaxID=2835864 RepID=UPI001BDC6D1A|nr:DUF2231 domain-containing protein [Nonomuraea sediminis]
MTPGKQPVSAVLAGPYGHPYHPILVTVPIGAWVSSLAFDVASHLVDDGRFLADGALWLIAIGIVGAVGAACVGALDLFAIPTGTRAFKTGLLHMTLTLSVTAAYAINLWWRLNGGEGAGVLVLNVAALAVLSVAGYLGGKLAFRYGVRVADESTQAEGFTHHAER